MENDNPHSSEPPAAKFVEGVDYYNEDGFMILTERFLLRRGYCCENGCRHCPYRNGKIAESQQKCL